MSRTKKKRQRADKATSAERRPNNVVPKNNAGREERAQPDYGGIPDIDLKKNLGCG